MANIFCEFRPVLVSFYPCFFGVCKVCLMIVRSWAEVLIAHAFYRRKVTKKKRRMLWNLRRNLYTTYACAAKLFQVSFFLFFFFSIWSILNIIQSLKPDPWCTNSNCRSYWQAIKNRSLALKRSRKQSKARKSTTSCLMKPSLEPHSERNCLVSYVLFYCDFLW